VTQQLWTEPDGVPAIRMRPANDQLPNEGGEYVLYWMIAFRRTQWNFALQRAVEWAQRLQKPLVVFEPLRVGYRWASDRIHRFVIDGMADNAQRIERGKTHGVIYFPYVEPEEGASAGLLETLAKRAAVLVTDDFPSFFLPRMVAAAAQRVGVRMEAIDSNGLLPIAATERVFTTAFSFRAFLQKELPKHLILTPRANPLARVKLPEFAGWPDALVKKWPAASEKLLAGQGDELASLPIDHEVGIVKETPGGQSQARRRLDRFLTKHLDRYATDANQPDEDARSGLSPYLHFGHIAAHELFSELMRREEWTPKQLGKSAGGKREGWWGASPSAEAWLDEFITWRELGYNMSANDSNYESYESLPDWSQATLAKHARDPREHVYELDEFAAARTHDKLWNAAQSQLLCEGRIHNYLRMLWGKKILEWTAAPRDALEVMIELNNRYALDGRNPNSYSGIFWVLGRYDRPWGPERPIFGTVRYMSSDNTARKLHVKQYFRRYG
jgi:deoxyribodipyrimidine photo-lyase